MNKINIDTIGEGYLKKCIKTIQLCGGSKLCFKDDRVLFDDDIAQGDAFYYNLKPGLEILISNVVFNRSLKMIRENSANPDYFFLQINFNLRENQPNADKTRKYKKPLLHNIYWTVSNILTGISVEEEKKLESVFICVSKKFLDDYGIHLKKRNQCFLGSFYSYMDVQEIDDLKESLFYKHPMNKLQRLGITGNILKLLALFIEEVSEEKIHGNPAGKVHNICEW